LPDSAAEIHQAAYNEESHTGPHQGRTNTLIPSNRVHDAMFGQHSTHNNTCHTTVTRESLETRCVDPIVWFVVVAVDARVHRDDVPATECCATNDVSYRSAS